MAILFDDDATDHLSANAAALTSLDFTFAARVNTDETTSSVQYQAVVGLFDASSTTGYFVMYLHDNTVTAFHAGGYNVDATATYSVNTWHHGCVVFTTAQARAFLDGGNKGTGSAVTSASGLDRTAIARAMDFTPGYEFSGRIAEVAIWNVALLDTEVLAHAKGVSALAIRSSALVAYWQLRTVADLKDRIGGFDMTASGGATAEHPLITYPSGIVVPHVAAAAPPADSFERMKMGHGR